MQFAAIKLCAACKPKASLYEGVDLAVEDVIHDIRSMLYVH